VGNLRIDTTGIREAKNPEVLLNEEPGMPTRRWTSKFSRHRRH